MSTYTPIATQTLGSAAASVTFSSIPQGYTDLIVVSNIIPSTTLTVNMSVGNNSLDTGTNYSCTRLYGSGTSAASDRSSSTANSFGNWTIGGGTSTGAIFITQLQNYSNATTYKTFLTRVSDMTLGYVGSLVSLWRSTSAINILSITGSSNFASGSTFSIYGIQVGNKAQKAQGGNIVTSDGTYVYHTFTSSGSFTPSTALTVDYLVVAGGGGGGYGNGQGGGGGAGGYRTSIGGSALSLTATSYPVTVGAGGAGGASQNNSTAPNGFDSVFATITSAGGGGGGNSSSNGASGGSGGGGSSEGTRTGGSASPSGQGSSGGTGNNTGQGGGGGGAGAVGGSPASGLFTTPAGAGGIGLNTNSAWASATSTGVSGYYAGGGGGSGYVGSGNYGAGGTGGGGRGNAGDPPSGQDNTAGTANTGGGGGAGAVGAGKAGGSGIVIIRYAI